MTISATRTGPARWRPWAALLLGAGVLLGCTSEGISDGSSPANSLDISLPGAGEAAPEEPAPEEPAPEQPAPEEPAPEEPVVEQPAPEEPAEDDRTTIIAATTEDEGWSSEQWAVLIILGFVALAVVIGIATFASRRSRSSQRQDDQRLTQQRRLDELTAGCRSIHDSAVLSILQTDNAALRNSTFAAARSQLLDLETRAHALSSELSEESQQRSLHELGVAIGGVRGALESNVGLRSETTGPGQDDLIDASNRTVLYRSEQLESALQQVLYIRL